MSPPSTTIAAPAASAHVNRGTNASTPTSPSKSDHWTVFKGLVPFIWPEGRPDLRFEVIIAFVVLVLAKLVTIAVPIVFKIATDMLTGASPGQPGTIGADALAIGATALIAAYGAGRVLMMV